MSSIISPSRESGSLGLLYGWLGRVLTVMTAAAGTDQQSPVRMRMRRQILPLLHLGNELSFDNSQYAGSRAPLHCLRNCCFVKHHYNATQGC